MKIVADIDIPYLRGTLEPFAEMVYASGAAISSEMVYDAEILLVRTRTLCDARLLEGSSIKLIITATIGFDHIDMTYCQAHNIEVITSAGCNSRGVLQWVAGTLAHLSIGDKWLPCEKTLGVVGLGHVGTLVADYAEAWGFKVLRCDPPRQEKEGDTCVDFVPLDTIIACADIITFHVPLTKQGSHPTHHLINSNNTTNCTHTPCLKTGSVIINSSRGAITDTIALKSAIRHGNCICAIDTWEEEPKLDLELLSLSTIATPHIAGYSAQGKANATAIIVNTISQKYGLPLTDWYPSQVNRSTARQIDWNELCTQIPSYFDVKQESLSLKSHPERFEYLRNNYSYREEFF